MKREQIKQQLQKIKEKGKERGRKIKGAIIKRKDDFLTALDKNWRDWLFRPLTNPLYKIGITANHISYLGFVLIGVTIFLYFKNFPIKWQLLFIALAAFSDMFDGPMARNNNNVTALGTLLDHIRDYTLVAWVTYIIYVYQLLSLQLIAILWGLQLILIWILTKDFLIKYLKELPDEKGKELFQRFSLNNLQASIIGRIQFAFWILGYISLIIYLMLPNLALITIGHTLLILAAIFAALNISEATKKTI